MKRLPQVSHTRGSLGFRDYRGLSPLERERGVAIRDSMGLALRNSHELRTKFRLGGTYRGYIVGYRGTHLSDLLQLQSRIHMWKTRQLFEGMHPRNPHEEAGIPQPPYQRVCSFLWLE